MGLCVFWDVGWLLGRREGYNNGGSIVMGAHWNTQNTSKYIKIHQNTSKYIKIHQNTSKYIKIHQNTSKYIKIHQNTSKYITIHVRQNQN